MGNDARRIFIAGIGTDVGKTLASACLVQALGADYWKPFQCGLEPQRDSELVQKLVTHHDTIVHPEAYCFKHAMSPHAASALEGINLKLSEISVPRSLNKFLIIEGVGGLLVPLNEQELVIDLISHFKSDVVLISRNYLGSINHSLLSLEALNSRGIRTLGIIFNGESNPASEDIILRFGKVPLLGRLPNLTRIDSSSVQQAGRNLNLGMFL